MDIKVQPKIEITQANGRRIRFHKNNDGSYQLYSSAPPGYDGFRAARLTEKEALGEILHELCLLA